MIHTDIQIQISDISNPSVNHILDIGILYIFIHSYSTSLQGKPLGSKAIKHLTLEWMKWKRMNEWMKSPEINVHICGQLIFDKSAKTIQWSKDSLSTNGIIKTGYPYSSLTLKPYTIINSKSIKDLKN